ncbi:putative disease resistance protein RGA1 [Pistacia vera]|uniref:putative disease resistance protein RGA1 n=1 Tax=Pistacia vera TaxID=55513 RepID=UPI001262E296|nr:putative disease resistance protein RGA1 [Pistacia vera]
MAETIVFAIAEQVLGKLIYLASNEMCLAWGVKNDAQELADTLTTIKVVLLDAEDKQIHNKKLKVWLGKFKEICYDAEDVLDEIEVEDLRKQVVNHQGITRKVCYFFSSSNPVAFRFILGHEIKEIKKRLAKIAAHKDSFNLVEKVDSNHVIGWERETHSFVHASDVIGRDKDKNKIMKLLLRPSDGHENVSVIPIVGIGGLGKTTLAKLVYNDKLVNEYFTLKMWVCVSDEFVLKKLLIGIIQSATGQKNIDENIDQLQRILRDILSHKKYLLVLDDVWNEDYEMWFELKKLLIECVSGSKIIVTTRSDRAASIMGTMPTYKLEGLSLDECLMVFVKFAFKEGQEKQYPNLMEIGIEIVKKCGGVPLAVKALGSLLYSSTSEQDWKKLRDNEIWELDQNENKILNALRISYNHLPPHLKQCFVYCSIFPKDFEFYSIYLVQFWMAHGLLQSHNENQDLENIGMQYIKELMSRSFFQDIVQDLFSKILFKLMRISIDIGCLQGLRRLWIYECPRLISLPHGVRKLRSLEHLRLRTCERLDLNLSIGSNKQENHDELSNTWPHLRYLRIKELPQLVEFPQWLIQCSTNTLESLEILNCSNLKALPESMEKLQALGVVNCLELSSLPKDMDRLIALRELTIRGCPKLSERCKQETGEDWFKIAHIPYIDLDDKIIKSTEN